MSSTRTKWAIGCTGCFVCLCLLMLLVVSLLPLFYLEENWRGAQELAAAKKRWQEAGYSLNPADYYPPPVSDDQNLAALPIFKLEPDLQNHETLSDLRLRAALDEDKHGGFLYSVNNQDLAKLVTKAYLKQFPSKIPSTSTLAQMEELYPLIVDLRTAAMTRPAFRLNLNYDFRPAWNRPFLPITNQIKVTKFLMYDAKLALRENQPQVALDDIKIGFQVARGVGEDPSLIGGLVSLGDCAIIRTPIDDGLVTRTWTDAQLAALENELKRVDCLSLFPFDMRAEVVMMSLPVLDMLKNRPSEVRTLEAGVAQSGSDQTNRTLSLWSMWATGWWDMNAAQTANAMLDNTACVDLAARRVYPDKSQQIEVRVNKAKDHPRPWNILFAVSTGAMTHALEKFAQGQVQLDEDRIVCGLERYRLAHGAYPATLEALVPACIDELPHDIMNGEPYHYRLNADGTFLLYSVGWNQTDDGGTVVGKQDNPKVIDYEQGDWVWPMVKR